MKRKLRKKWVNYDSIVAIFRRAFFHSAAGRSDSIRSLGKPEAMSQMNVDVFSKISRN